MQGASTENRDDNDRWPVMTKENFWGQIEKDYPDEYKKFGAWVDEYKIRNNWQQLFNARESYQDEDKWDYEKNKPFEHPAILAPKVHQLPIAMQVGIFIQYTQETECLTPFEPELGYMETIGQAMEEWFQKETLAQNGLGADHGGDLD